MVDFPKVTNEEREKAQEGKPQRDPVPEGKYTFTIGTVKERALPDGTPEWSIQVEIQDGPSKGRWLFDTLTWSKEWRWKQILVLEACGFDLSQDLKIKPEDLEGVTAQGIVKHATKNGKTYSNLRGWRAMDSEDEDTPF